MLKLSEQEKQEIIRYLEADKELPEKYRFLLFGDKREVELVWNRKTSPRSPTFWKRLLIVTLGAKGRIPLSP